MEKQSQHSKEPQSERSVKQKKTYETPNIIFIQLKPEERLLEYGAMSMSKVVYKGDMQ